MYAIYVLLSRKICQGESVYELHYIGRNSFKPKTLQQNMTYTYSKFDESSIMFEKQIVVFT